MKFDLATKAFIQPKSLVEYKIGKYSVKLYPKREVGETWGEQERQLAFNITKEALLKQRFPRDVIIDVLAEHFHAMSQVTIFLQAYLTACGDILQDPSKLQPVSYHSSDGVTLQNVFDPASATFNIVPSPDRPNSVKYLKLKATLNLSHVGGLTALRQDYVTFYVELNQTATNRTRAGKTKATFEEADDWFNVIKTSADPKVSWLTFVKNNNELNDTRPFILIEPGFDSDLAIPDYKRFSDKLLNLITDICFEPLIAYISSLACGVAVIDPYELFSQMKQPPEMSVSAYHDTFNSLLLTLPHNQSWSADVHRIFVGGLDEKIRAQMEQGGYLRHTQVVSLAPSDQTKFITEAFHKAMTAQKQLLQTTNIISAQIQGLQAFHNNIIVDSGAHNSVYQSAAERAIQAAKRNSTVTPKLGANGNPMGPCWGCNDPNHMWWDRITKKITCPLRNDPKCIQAADEKFKKWKNNKFPKKGGEGTKSTKPFTQFKKQAMESFFDQLISEKIQQCFSSESNKSTKSKDGQESNANANATSPTKKAKFNLCFFGHILTLHSRRSNGPLPINVEQHLPHINLKLGTSDASWNPALTGIIDTGASLTTGYSEYILSIAEAHPELVSQIVWADESTGYDPILLSGVVGHDVDLSPDNLKHLSTQLPCIVTFHMPYTTKQGGSTSLNIAVGKNVAVNLLLGMSFIKQIGMTIDIVNEIVDCETIDTSFKIAHRIPQRGKPSLITSANDSEQSAFKLTSESKSKLETIAKIRKVFFQDAETSPANNNKKVKVYNDTSHCNSNQCIDNPDPTVDPMKHPNLQMDPSTDIDSSINPSKNTSENPIRVPKHKKRKHQNKFTAIPLRDDLADHDFLQVETVGRLVSKATKPMRDSSDTDPRMLEPFNPDTDQEFLNKHLKIPDKIDPTIKTRLTQIIIKYWGCFNPKNVCIPIADYECHIDTGSAAPIACKNLRFGLHETQIMNKHIESLIAQGLVIPETQSQWLSKPTLAPKPHQEHITESTIDEFIWRFCVNYIPLNSVTKQIAYPIPRCDDAIQFRIGPCKHRIVMDAVSGFHQIKMSADSQGKLAFAAPDGRKLTYIVMPFGITNGPTYFVIMIYDQREYWQLLATNKDLTLDYANNSTIIIDDTMIASDSQIWCLDYLECILEVSQRYNLSWNLKKCTFFDTATFVGVDIADEGNKPSQSKNPLFEMWKNKPIESTRDCASFIGLVGFYREWIPFFENRLIAVRKLMSQFSYDDKLTKEDVPSEVYTEINNLLEIILSAPILTRADIRKRFYVRVDSCNRGYGTALLQPGDDPESIAAMTRENEGHICEFETTRSSKLKLHPLGFAARKTSASEQFYHSFLQEAIGANWAIDKWQPYLWGRPFTLITDCSALQWFQRYEGDNPAIRRLQFGLLGMQFTIVHRPAYLNADADGLSRLGVDCDLDMTFTGKYSDNPILDEYYKIATQLSQQYPGTSGEITHSVLPGARRQKALPTTQDIDSSSNDHHTSKLHHVGISFCYHTSLPSNNQHLHNHDILRNAFQITHHNIIISGSGACTIFNHNSILNWNIVGVMESSSQGRGILSNCYHGKIWSDSLLMFNDLQHHLIKESTIQGYYITHLDTDIDNLHRTLSLQTQLLSILHSQYNLMFFVLILHCHTPQSIIKKFIQSSHQWVITQNELQYTHFGNAIDDSSIFLIGWRRFTSLNHDDREHQFQFKLPPAVFPSNISNHIIAEFNKKDIAMIPLPPFNSPSDNPTFELEIHESNTPNSPYHSAVSHTLNYIHPERYNIRNTCIGNKIIDSFYPAPPLEPLNFNPFRELFGITYTAEDNQSYIRCFSRFEYCKCFGIQSKLINPISIKPEAFNLLRNSIPSEITRFIMETVTDHLLDIRINESDDNDHAAAAFIPALLNGITHIEMPDRTTWIKAYQDDPECKIIMDAIKADYSPLDKSTSSKIHYVYRPLIRDRMIVIEDEFLIVLQGVSSTASAKLRVVPASLQDIIFIAFHSNPAGGHMSAYHTYHRIRLRYFFPGMYQYVKRMCKACTACNLANSRRRVGQDYIYSFPMCAPMRVVCLDGYKAGDIPAFSGHNSLLTVLDHFSGYAIVEEMIGEINSKTFMAAFMKTQCQHGFSHTVIVDKDSKFRKVFEEGCKILKVNIHFVSANNHDAIYNERFHVFLNKGLTILSNERNSSRTFCENSQLLTYAWNSAPMSETDITKSLVVTGREYEFPIDHVSPHDIDLEITPEIKHQYTKDLIQRLNCQREIFELLVNEHRILHREIVNLKRPTPFKFTVGDLVWARHEVRSNKNKGIVGKLQYKNTGPWEITKILPGGSYQLQHYHNHDNVDKRKYCDLQPFPERLLCFPPLSGADERFASINREITKDPYLQAGKKGYDNYEPACSDLRRDSPPLRSNLFVQANHKSKQYKFPTVEELNKEMMEEGHLHQPYQIIHEPPTLDIPDQGLASFPSNQNNASINKSFEQNQGVKETATLLTLESNNLLHQLSRIPNPSDRLFFIRHCIPNSARHEWRLIQVNWEDTKQLNPGVFNNGRVLATFYMQHPHDLEYTTPNQRFWKQYHQVSNTNQQSEKYHLVIPNSNEFHYCAKHSLKPYQEWIHITDPSIYLLGPFGFANIHGIQSKDRISDTILKSLAELKHRYDNDPPSISRNHLITYLYTPIHGKYTNNSIMTTIRNQNFINYMSK